MLLPLPPTSPPSHWSHLRSVMDWVFWLVFFAVLAARSFEKSDDRPVFVKKWIWTFFLTWLMFVCMRTGMFFLFILPMVIIAFIWVPSWANFGVKSLTGAFDGGGDEVEAKPFYHLAEGLRRKGQPAEAIAEIKKQLESFPGDYEGYTRLATIEVEDLKDLPAAEATLNEFLVLPGRAPGQVIGALHLLADWQLQHGKSAEAASQTLQRIVQLYPETPFAHAAEQRIAHLVNADETRREREEKKFTVTPRERDVGLRKEAAPATDASDPYSLADQYVKQLERHPTDTDAREKLAVLYAEEFHRIDLAADQLEQLVALPAEPPKHVAGWLNLLATLQIQQAQDLEAAKSALRRIVEKFPGSAVASQASNRLGILALELKPAQAVAIKSLGDYGKNLGLNRAGG